MDLGVGNKNPPQRKGGDSFPGVRIASSVENLLREAGVTESDGVDQEALQEFLLRMASRHIWWQEPEQALNYPKRILAQVMDRGDYDAILEVGERVGEKVARHVVQTAEAGWFSPTSWHFWHCRLALCDPESIPPLPKKTIPWT